MWKEDPDKPGGGKWNKIPRDARTGKARLPFRPQHVVLVRGSGPRLQVDPRRYAGVGFVFREADPFAGIDLDNCILTGEEGRALTPFAARIVADSGTYAEVSPSGTGIKLVTRATLPPGPRRRDTPPAVEMYDQSRFFTVTGRPWPGSVAGVEDGQSWVEALHAELFPPAEAPKAGAKRKATPVAGLPQNDGDLLELAFRASNGEKTRALYNGDTSEYQHDKSRGDIALCALLAFYTGDDPARLDRLFAAPG
jgi:primase-polymerase (primpol)-like protein